MSNHILYYRYPYIITHLRFFRIVMMLFTAWLFDGSRICVSFSQLSLLISSSNVLLLDLYFDFYFFSISYFQSKLRSWELVFFNPFIYNYPLSSSSKQVRALLLWGVLTSTTLLLSSNDSYTEHSSVLVECSRQLNGTLGCSIS